MTDRRMSNRDTISGLAGLWLSPAAEAVLGFTFELARDGWQATAALSSLRSDWIIS